ncbi:nuclear protein Es2-domain-containing protein [Blastocladiella britannica]|nr:nuclear protein Es2-domain-containing protein [Blastocladiella britannica]
MKIFNFNIIMSGPPRALDEDSYTATLSAIIERDYFPDLATLRAESALLEAIDAGDRLRARAAQAAVQRAHARADNPFATIGDTGDPEDLPLAAFLASYTSHDNKAFSELLGEHNERVRDRVRRFIMDSGGSVPLAIENGDRAWVGAASTAQRQLLSIEASHASSSTALVRQSSDLVATTEGHDDEDRDAALALILPNSDRLRSAGGSAVVPTWRNTTTNLLNPLFFPSAVPSIVTRTTGDSAHVSLARRAATNRTGMRFARSTPLAAFEAAVTAASAAAASDDGTSGGGNGGNQYDLVSMTPRAHAVAADLPPEFTWGELAATPVPLGHASGDLSSATTPVRGYQVPGTSKREQAAEWMADRQSGRHHHRQQSSRGSTTPLTARSSVSAISSAAGKQRRTGSAGAAAAARGVLGRTPARAGDRSRLARAGGVDDMLRASYSRTPVATRTPATGRRTPGMVGGKLAGETWTARSTATNTAALATTPFSFTPVQSSSSKQ